MGELNYVTTRRCSVSKVGIAKTLATAPASAKWLMGDGPFGVLKSAGRCDAWFAAMIRSDTTAAATPKAATAERWCALYKGPRR